jgi:hypothetical protein
MIRLPGLSDPGRGPSGMPVSTVARRVSTQHSTQLPEPSSPVTGVCPVVVSGVDADCRVRRVRPDRGHHRGAGPLELQSAFRVTAHVRTTRGAAGHPAQPSFFRERPVLCLQIVLS